MAVWRNGDLTAQSAESLYVELG